jgi:DNA-binding CsgD family transcriptional regulator
MASLFHAVPSGSPSLRKGLEKQLLELTVADRADLINRLVLQATEDEYRLIETLGLHHVKRKTDFHLLPKMEKEAICWFMNGKTAKEVGALIGITQRQASYLKTQAMKKLHVSSTTELIRYMTRGNRSQPELVEK